MGTLIVNQYLNKLWTPSQIATALWLDAADSSTVTESGGLVSQWNDKSPDARHVAQAGSTLQPTYTTGSHLTFDGVDDFLFTANYLFSDSSNTGLTLFAVASSIASDDTIDFIYDFGFIGSDGYGLTYNRNRIVSYSPLDFGGAAHDVNTYSFSTSPQILGLNIAFGSNQVTSANGTVLSDLPITLTQLTATEIKEGPTRQLNTSPVCIGRQGKSGSDTSRALNGNLYELIVVRQSLSLTDTQKLEGYLAHKWGLTANLPVTHPYKNTPPYV